MPRPANPNALTPAQRTAARRAACKLRKVELTLPMQADLAAIRQRGGDPSDRAAVERVLREAAGGLTP